MGKVPLQETLMLWSMAEGELKDDLRKGLHSAFRCMFQ